MALRKGKHRAITHEEQRAMTEEVAGRDSGFQGTSTQAKPPLSRDTSTSHYVDAHKASRRKTIIKRVLITLACVVAAGAVAVLAYIGIINTKLSSGVDSDLLSTLVSTDTPTDPFYMLLLGTDKDEERSESSEYGSSDSAYRSDSIILARIDPTNKKVTLVSIPRDTKVDLGEYGTQKINAAYALGGSSYATQVVAELAGVSISHYAEVNMDGMAAIVDQVGGVDIDLPVDVVDPDYTGLDLKAGTQHLDGQTAALLCRARHAYDAYGDGDSYRAANQRAVIQAVAEKVLDSDLLSMVSTVQTMADYITCDMNVQEIVSLAAQFRGIDTNSDIMSGMMPTTSSYENNLWYQVVDETAWKTMMERVDQGLSPNSDDSEDETSGVSATSAQGSSSGSSGGSSGDGSDSDDDTSSSANEPSSVDVVVCNASGVTGVAGNAANKLIKQGYPAMATNTTGSHVSDSMVVYNGDHEADAQAIADILGGNLSVSENDGTWDQSVDVVVVLGTDWSQ